MEIYIISSGRPARQTTFDNLPKALQERVRIVVPEQEVPAYKKYPVIGIPVFGVAKTRQWCIENAPSGRVAMLDDDLVFATRREDNPTKFRDATAEELVDLFGDINESLADYAHVGVATREGGNRNTDATISVTRMLRVLCYDTAVVRGQRLRFDAVQGMEDFYMTLSLLCMGYPNLVLNDMVHNQNGSNLQGGCSQYRTKEAQYRDAHALKDAFPDFVSVTEKTTKAAWGSFGGSRTDVVIQWKKAYASSSACRFR